MKTEQKYNYSDLMKLTGEYIKHSNNNQEDANKEIYDLCDSYWWNQKHLSNYQNDKLLNYFNR